MSAPASEERLYQVLVAPVVSEKSTIAAETHGQFVFRVLPDATRVEVKAAIEKAFEVEVESVKILNVRGKVKRFGGSVGRRNSWKKAYIRLKQGNDIDFAAFQS
jgi:large subunit ribosomal protein L23